MKIILSKKAKKKDKKLRTYWKTIYPNKYVDILIDEQILDKIKIASRKKQVSLVGILKKTKDNFVYLDISNNLLNGLYNMLSDEDIDKPPYNQKSFNDVGAHVSVIGSSEYKDNDLKEITEINKEFEFKTGKIYSVDPEGWDEMQEVWFMDIDSPSLEKLRQKYGLSKLMKDHNFHITFAVKKK